MAYDYTYGTASYGGVSLQYIKTLPEVLLLLMISLLLETRARVVVGSMKRMHKALWYGIA